MYVEEFKQIAEMKPSKTLSITEARKIIFKMADDVQKPDTYYTLTENGRPKAVVMSAEEFDSWQETMEVLSDPRLLKDIKIAQAEFDNGEYVTLDQLLKEEGYVRNIDK